MGQQSSTEKINMTGSIATAPFGKWDSPLDGGQISGAKLGFGSPRCAVCCLILMLYVEVERILIDYQGKWQGILPRVQTNRCLGHR
jgi:hypothetical protein